MATLAYQVTGLKSPFHTVSPCFCRSDRGTKVLGQPDSQISGPLYTGTVPASQTDSWVYFSESLRICRLVAPILWLVLQQDVGSLREL